MCSSSIAAYLNKVILMISSSSTPLHVRREESAQQLFYLPICRCERLPSSLCPPYKPALSAWILLFHPIPVLWNEFYHQLEAKREEKWQQKVSKGESCRISVQVLNLSLLVNVQSPTSTEDRITCYAEKLYIEKLELLIIFHSCRYSS